jgi:hypothetical protein
MIDILIEKLRSMNLIDWGVILEGVNGIPGLNIKLSSSEVSRFACEKLIDIDEENVSHGQILQLACAEENSEGEIVSLLKEICKNERIELDVSHRKWRLVMLSGILENLPDDPLYALMDLSQFWTVWGNPTDSPHVIQGVDNEMSPNEYYTIENKNKLLEKHKVWLEEEMRIIKFN